VTFAIPKLGLIYSLKTLSEIGMEIIPVYHFGKKVAPNEPYVMGAALMA